jgi:hypothetical protein
MPNLFDEWRADHESHRVLLAMIDSETDCERRFALFAYLARELCVHMAIEERTLYARLALADDTRRRAAHSILEHQDIEELLETLYAMDVEDPHWLRTFRVLHELIERHEAEEDEALFRDTMENFDLEEASAMRRRCMQDQHRLSASAVRHTA